MSSSFKASTTQTEDAESLLFCDHITNLIQTLEPHLSESIALIASERVAHLHLEPIRKALLASKAINKVIFITQKDDDEDKTIESANALWQALFEGGCTRETTLIALGGGMIGDLVGFVASTFKRGIPWLNIPTTLLAQVDACIGGKTAINSTYGKNLIGSFHRAKAVIVCPEFLKTLDQSMIRSGCAEMIKYGLTFDKKLFHTLEQTLPRFLNHEFDINPIKNCLLIKQRVCENDFKESGQRLLLNFGHTIGHAIETESNYTIPHGFAVSIGMACAIELSWLSEDEKTQIIQCLMKLGLPTTIPAAFDLTRLLATIQHDKKNTRHGIRFIALEQIGQAKVVDLLSEDELLQAMIKRLERTQED